MDSSHLGNIYESIKFRQFKGKTTIQKNFIKNLKILVLNNLI